MATMRPRKGITGDPITVPVDVLGRRRKTTVIEITRNTPAAPPHDVLGRATTASGRTYEMRLDHRRHGDPSRYEERAYNGRPAKRLCPECRCTDAHRSGCGRPDTVVLDARLAPPRANASDHVWRRFAALLRHATPAQRDRLSRRRP